MTENWWYVWRSVTFDGTFDNECHVVRYDNKYPVEQHLILEKCLQHETWVVWHDGYTVNLKCLTNDKPAFDRHVWSDEFEDWFDRIIWYAKDSTKLHRNVSRLTVLPRYVCLTAERNSRRFCAVNKTTVFVKIYRL
jgi:hypothetical protein